jgi:undecaprenyl-phosphate galactose phosphotransferase
MNTIPFTASPHAVLSTALYNAEPHQEQGADPFHEWSQPSSFAGRRFPVERLFLAGDMAALLAAFIIGGLCAWCMSHYVFGHSGFDLFNYGALREFLTFMLVGSLALFWLDTKGHYTQRLPHWETMSHLMSVTTIGFFISGFTLFVFKSDGSRLWMGMSWFCFAAFFLAGRNIVKKLLKIYNKWIISVVLIGEGPAVNSTIKALHAETEMGYRIVKVLPVSVLEELTTPGSWADLMHKAGGNHFLLAAPDYKTGYYQTSLSALIYARLPYSIVPASSSLPSSTLSSHYLFTHGVTILHHTNRLQLMLPRIIKRSFDIIISVAALVIFSPIMAMIMLMIKVDGGPAVFGHKRVGQHGKIFQCLKFRSMVMNGEEVLQRHFAKNPAALAEWQAGWKLRDDPRVTGLGRFLRKTSIDELPQLLNVLKGEMSLVGPRPIIVAECANYNTDITLYYMVRPGITGLWQISGRNDVSYRERVEMDSRYIRNWSFWHDIAIVLKTFGVLVKRTGAY